MKRKIFKILFNIFLFACTIWAIWAFIELCPKIQESIDYLKKYQIENIVEYYQTLLFKQIISSIFLILSVIINIFSLFLFNKKDVSILQESILKDRQEKLKDRQEKLEAKKAKEKERLEKRLEELNKE